MGVPLMLPPEKPAIVMTLEEPKRFKTKESAEAYQKEHGGVVSPYALGGFSVTHSRKVKQ